VDLQKDKLTWREARRNLNEFSDILDEEHKLEVLKKIWEKEDEDIFESYLFMYKKNV
tara:strand:+ start:1344 stop:1514 length:171 start_codon:yes stop_codon:yes gene_type:complete